MAGWHDVFVPAAAQQELGEGQQCARLPGTSVPMVLISGVAKHEWALRGRRTGVNLSGQSSYCARPVQLGAITPRSAAGSSV